MQTEVASKLEANYSLAQTVRSSDSGHIAQEEANMNNAEWSCDMAKILKQKNYAP